MTKENNSTPSELGFRMPAEWEKRESTWISWPHNDITWESPEEIEGTYIEIIGALHTDEKINVLVNDDKEALKVREKLIENNIDAKKVQLHKIKTVDAWIRDYGPNFLIKKELIKKEKNYQKDNLFPNIAFNHWIFNAWGNKYGDLKQDTKIPGKINEFLKLRCFNPNIVLEGGSIEVNGKGICMTTEQCLLNKNRNPHLSKKEIEQYLKDYLGVNKILWLKDGIAGDDTDGHIDDIARFANENIVLCCFAEKNDRNYDALNENYEILKKNSKDFPPPYNVVKIPVPNVEDDGKPLPASYANFYIGAKKVLVPIFEDKNDSKALEIIQKCFPERKIFGINCRKLVYGLGAIHCITQQQPAL